MPSGQTSRNPFEILSEEFLERVRRGESVTPEDYALKHPELADEIRALFPALLMMEDLGDETLDPTSSRGSESRSTPGAAPGHIGEFRLLREVGRGGMGVVYEAEQESLGRRVALKVLASGALTDANQVRRFEREARAAARLHHTNIVPVFGVGQTDGTHYYVMQFIQGQGLDAVFLELKKLRHAREARSMPSLPTGRGEKPHAAAEIAHSLVTGQFGYTAISKPTARGNRHRSLGVCRRSGRQNPGIALFLPAAPQPYPPSPRPIAGSPRPWPASAFRSQRGSLMHTPRASSTVISSRQTCCSIAKATSGSQTSGWPRPPAAKISLTPATSSEHSATWRLSGSRAQATHGRISMRWASLSMSCLPCGRRSTKPIAPP